mmetsp:Transcript_5291/g.18435  ORF Transcript_5291/g.18435 Transcript_5291/m.18435 type:complete len:234 (+) Transcript_5291:246-947(+)
METSSVTSSPSRLTSSNPSLRSCGRITCGVCISHRRERSSVLTTSPSAPASFTVALHCTPSTAAPTSAASASTARTSSYVTRGRALSWMHASAADSSVSDRPLKTLSCRSSPGSANLMGTSLAVASAAVSNTSRYVGSQTTTTSITSSIVMNVSRLYVAIGRPSSSKYCFGMAAPMRLPTPPASRTTETERGATSADAVTCRALRLHLPGRARAGATRRLLALGEESISVATV